MDGTAVKAIADLAQQAALETVAIGDTFYSALPLLDPRRPEPEPKPLDVETLSGFVGYIKAGRDFDRADALVVVEEPGMVRLVTNLTGRFQQRFCYAIAVAPNRLALGSSEFRFGTFFGLEVLIIAVQSVFQDAADRSKVLQLLGTVKDEAVKTSADDGVTQTVTARSGIAVVSEIKVPNPVTLAPFRTFAEIEQPSSPFVFRMRKGDTGPQAALFEADGGGWKSKAKASIVAYLNKELTGTNILVIA